MATDTFFIHSADGSKITDEDDLASLSVCLSTMLDAHYAMKSPQSDRLLLRPSAVGRANDRLLHSLMDRYLKSDVLSVQESIIQHVEYSVRAPRARCESSRAARSAPPLSRADGPLALPLR